MKLLKTMLVSSVVVLSTFNLSGCETMGNHTELKMKTSAALTESFPVKSPVFNKVESAVVADYSNLINEKMYSADVLSIYQLMTQAVELQLDAAKLYKMSDRAAFIQAFHDVAPDVNVLTATNTELSKHFRNIRRKLGVHAVVDVRLTKTKQVPTDLASQLNTLDEMIDDHVKNKPMNLTITMYRTKTGEVLYQQTDTIHLDISSQGMRDVAHERLVDEVNRAIEPIINDMVTHF